MRTGKWMLVLALAAMVAPAQAVDVDRIEVRSSLGEPLLAEIPITNATPQELQALEAQLAPAVTFARIGLPRPTGVVADLRFEVVRGARPVIRITSAQPVNDTFLTFLVQVDAPNGQLVREYSVSLGASPAIPAMAPSIQAPEAAPASAIVREQVRDPAAVNPPPIQAPIQAPAEQALPPPTAAQPASPIPLKGDPKPAKTPAATASPAAQGSSRPAPAAAAAPIPVVPRKSAASRPQQPAAPAPASRPSAPPPGPPGPGDHVVRAGENLTGIVGKMTFGDSVSEQQAMLALLRTNPHAFPKGNVNLLRQGAVLRRPAAAELTRLDAAAAEAAVRLQIQQWQSGNMPDVPIAAAPASVPGAAPVEVASVAQAAPADARVAPARLEIAPDGDAAGGSASNPGGMAGADPARAAADQVAARYTQMQEMRARIAELEQSQAEQRRLIELQQQQLSGQGAASAGAWPWIVAALALLAAIFAFWRKPGEMPGAVALRLRRRFGQPDSKGAP